MHATILTNAQREDLRALMSLEGLTREQARYRVLTPEQRAAFTGQVLAASRARREQDPRGEILKRKAASARHSGVEFSITAADLDWPTHCPVTGVELYYGGDTGRRGARADAASIDRIDNGLGYVPGNVVIVSYWVNARKGDASPEQLQAIAAFYSKT